MNIYIASTLDDEYGPDTISIHDSFDGAKAAIHRYMNYFGFKFEYYIWDNESWIYRDKNQFCKFHIGKFILNEEKHK